MRTFNRPAPPFGSPSRSFTPRSLTPLRASLREFSYGFLSAPRPTLLARGPARVGCADLRRPVTIRFTVANGLNLQANQYAPYGSLAAHRIIRTKSPSASPPRFPAVIVIAKERRKASLYSVSLNTSATVPKISSICASSIINGGENARMSPV